MGSPAMFHIVKSLWARSLVRRRALETFGAFPLLPYSFAA